MVYYFSVHEAPKNLEIQYTGTNNYYDSAKKIK